MAEQDGRHQKMVMRLLRHVTPYKPHDADVKGDIFRHSTIYLFYILRVS